MSGVVVRERIRSNILSPSTAAKRFSLELQLSRTMGHKIILGNGELTCDLENNPLAAGLEEVRSSWGWFLALGILLVVLGAVCVIGNVSATSLRSWSLDGCC